MALQHKSFTEFEKKTLYARLNRRYINMEAIFSDETNYYVIPNMPATGEAVVIKLRAALGDLEKATLHICGDLSDEKHKMEVGAADDIFEYFQAAITAGSGPMLYYFTVHKNGKTYFYNKRGLHEALHPEYHFKLIPGFIVPEWARGAVMYQIFVDRFYNGDPANDVVDYEYIYLGKPVKKQPWNKDLAAGVGEDIRNFCGGDLRGVMDKMEYLKSLGVEALYLNPIFVSPSTHKYDIQDYDHIDPHFGVIVNDEGKTLSFEKFHNRYATKYISRTTDIKNLEASDKLFAELIAMAHENGIKVIIDGVFNHCGSFNKWLDKGGFYAAMDYSPGAYKDKKSPYNKYFIWFNSDWPNNDCYDGWWGNDNHPKLNFEDSPELYEYIMGIARKWVSPPFMADGWRLDVAADLGRSPAFNHKFWQDFRKAVKSANPEAIILAENYGDSSPWLNGNEWDTIMNYEAFMVPITWFLTGVSKHSDESRPDLINNSMAFESSMRYHMAQMNIHSIQTSMNELSNHDHSRFLTRTNRMTGRMHTDGPRAAERDINKNVMLEALMFQMTWPGAPTVYYGDEAGLAGWTDPDNRRPFPWGKEDPLMLEAHKKLIEIRKTYPALRTGSLEFLHNDTGFISYGRWDNSHTIVVAINNNQSAKEVSLPVWKTGCLKCKMERVAAVYDGRIICDNKVYTVKNGALRATIPGTGAFMFVQKK